jgi:CHAT domain-containing protein
MDSLHELLALSGNHQSAFSRFIEILSADKKFIDEVLGFIPEDQQLDYLIAKQKNLHAFFTLVIRHLPHSPNTITTAFNTWISRKGLTLEAQSRFQEALFYSDDPETVKVVQQLARVRAQLSKRILAGTGKSGDTAKDQQIVELEQEKQRLETKLIRLSQTYKLKKRIDAADSRKIAERLPEGTVLLDFARVNMFNYEHDGEEQKWLPPHYIVFVLHAGSGERLALIDLGEADKIDTGINRFRRLFDDQRDRAAGGRRLQKSAQRLHTLVFAPIAQALGDQREIFISPDGNLNLVPFELLQRPSKRYLIEDYSFNYLAASRDVIGFGRIGEKAGKSVIIGDPDFDLGSKSPPRKAEPVTDRSSKQIAKRSTRMAGLHFDRLANTKKEVMAIQGLLGRKNAALYMDKAASESTLFGHKAPRFLHLATHGFFLSDRNLDALANKNTITATGVPAAQAGNTVSMENPLLLSGIALAGANTALKRPSTQTSEGIVTAEKILGLRLRGTEMVVLSACQTGEGRVQSGEGVFGLRRAFVQAGTKSLVMSMWEVPDQETQELMVQFYQNIAAGMNRNQALRQAALKQMKIAEKRHGHSHPFFWGAFVFLGEA